MAYPAIFFCFDSNPNDKPETPNKIFLDKDAPTLGDFAAALKSVFKISDTLSFRISGDENTFHSDESLLLAPINDRNRIVFVRLGAPPDVVEAADIESWLQKEGIDAEVIRVFKDNRINAQNMKNLTEEGLTKMGINHWVVRSQVLDAIKKYDTASTLVSPLVPNISGLTSPDKRKHEDLLDTSMETAGSADPPPNKRFKMGRNKQVKIKIKDVDVLVHCEKMPIKMGMCVYTGAVNNASGPVFGTIVQHRDKASIEYNINGETRYGNISKFYRDVTGDALQEKGPSWGNIFFKDADGQVYSLESLKYIIYGPKRPVSAFLYFSNEARIKHKDLKPDAFARLAGDLWRKLSNEEKEPYRVLEDQDKVRFTRERQDWEGLLAKYQVQNANNHQTHAQHQPPHTQFTHSQLQHLHAAQQQQQHHPQHPQHPQHSQQQQQQQQQHQHHQPQHQHPHPQHPPHHQHQPPQPQTHHSPHPVIAGPPPPQPPPQPQQHLVQHESLQPPVHHDQLVEAPIS